jgi:septal ring factor EnvC (AmiA/AmiB activator)
VTSINDLWLSRRTRNCLKSAGIFTLEAIVATSDKELMSIHGFGSSCLKEVREPFQTSSWKQSLRDDKRRELEQLSKDFPRLRRRIDWLEKELVCLKQELSEKTADITASKEKLQQEIKLIESDERKQA